MFLLAKRRICPYKESTIQLTGGHDSTGCYLFAWTTGIVRSIHYPPTLGESERGHHFLNLLQLTFFYELIQSANTGACTQTICFNNTNPPIFLDI